MSKELSSKLLSQEHNQSEQGANIDEDVKSIEFCYFGTGLNIWWRLFYMVLNFFLFGLVDAIMLLSITEKVITKMVIGGRKLKFDTHDPYAKIPLLCIIHNTINNFTFGIWKMVGMMDRFLYSELDKRIYWGDLKSSQLSSRIVWFPNDDGKGEFKIITASAGLIPGIIISIARLVSGLVLGLGDPWILSYEFSNTFPNMIFGGKGQFQYSDKAPSPESLGSDSLHLKFEATGLQIMLKLWLGNFIGILSLGLSYCCFWSLFYSFLNKYIRVNEVRMNSIDKIRMGTSEKESVYYSNVTV